jgi:hypothetical protein
MNDYTCKIPRSNNVFVGSESAGASSDILIDVISPLAAGYPSRSGMGSDYRYSILSAGVATLNAPTAHTGYEENSSAAIPLSEPRKEMVHRTYATIQLTSLLSSQWRREHRAPVRCELDYQSRIQSGRCYPRAYYP